MNDEYLIYKNDNKYYAIRKDGFVNLQESISGFGDTPQEALNELLKQYCECGELIPLDLPECQRTGMCEACLDDSN